MRNETTKENKMRTYLPKTKNYIDSLEDSERRGHHVYVAEREMMNALIPCDKMGMSQLEEMDSDVLDHLKYLDS